MTGLRFGRLVGVAFSHAGRGGRAQWLFACDCGVGTIADGGNVRAGNTASCGCLHREISAARLTIHGHRAGGRHGPAYRAWQQMNDSCANPASGGWKHCGARGIAVAARWRDDFAAFLADMGDRPDRAVLARLDTDADFSPANCCWSDVRSRAKRAADGARTRRSAATHPRRDGPAPPRVEPVGGFVPDPSGACIAAVVRSGPAP